MADIEIRQESPTAFYIKVDETDNVAIIVNDRGLTAGTRFPDGLTLVEQLLPDRHVPGDEAEHVLGHIGVDVHDRRAGEHVARATGEHAGVARPPADESNGAGAGGAASSHGFLSLQRFFVRHWMWRKLHVKRVRGGRFWLVGLAPSRAGRSRSLAGLAP